MAKLILCFIVLAWLASPPAQASDIKKGARIYKKCAACHMIGAQASNHIGPQLNNIVGRAIAALSDYKYSRAMKTYAISEKTWGLENLNAYLENPRATVRGTRMSFAGLRKAQDRADVIAYMKSASPQ